ncbi:hypothetical protein PHMEG_00033749 [Phytophthora megakarya]|uniref:Peptidase A2 domain-containing protein n=1 Tax=Phytophthora megakarya TaxID=4795 RepID=A0A225UT23_9STRA|nr:hypothetical protein PHMEG_00033749 [Phytophthora megakarya]
MNQDCPIEPVQVQPDLTESESPVEFSLRPGQRYGWWEDHETDDSYYVALPANDERTKMLLDSGASGSMISLDLARSLKLKVRMLADPVKVSGLGRVQSYITAMARLNVVYVMNVWVGSPVGKGIHVCRWDTIVHAGRFSEDA